MDKYVIRGGNPLVGTIYVSGAKNSALPCMAAAILTEDEVTLDNIPQVRDIETERRLLGSMGAEVHLGDGSADHSTTISCRTLSDPEAKYEIVKTMRASSLVLGPLIARAGMARVAMPGGCAIGGRLWVTAGTRGCITVAIWVGADGRLLASCVQRWQEPPKTLPRFGLSGLF